MLVDPRRVARSYPAISAPGKEFPDEEWARQFLVELRAIVGQLGDTDLAEHALRNGMDGNYFSTTLTRLHKVLKLHLGAAARPYRITDGGRRPRLYSLNLPATAVTLLE